MKRHIDRRHCSTAFRAGVFVRSASTAVFFTVLLLGAVPALGQAQKRESYSARDDVRSFVREMIDRHQFVEQELGVLFARARRQEQILRAIAPPPPDRPRQWDAYRAQFVTARHIELGIAFWNAHRATLERAQTEFGVPAEIIVSIIGIETNYGRNMGRWRVADALVTLAFDYPPRAAFFRSELEQFLLLAREMDLDVFSIQGSYAGAIGIPQFMPGSHRRYALDYDGDGRIDLRSSPVDAIGSVGRFLREHGWQDGGGLSIPAHVAGDAHRDMLAAGLQPSVKLADLRRFGVETRSDLALDTLVALIDLPGSGKSTGYRLGLQNFYVITRYNRSSFYASAVIDLARALKEARTQ